MSGHSFPIKGSEPDNSEISRFRRQVEQVQNDVRSAERRRGGGERVDLLVQTKSVTSYPTTPNSVFAATIVRVSGVEKEAAAPTLTAGGAGETVYVYNTGRSVPPVGTYLIAVRPGTRWVVSYNG